MLDIYISLFVGAAIYAFFLNLEPINRWYNNDRVWLTVVVGNGLVLIGLYALEQRGALTTVSAFLANLAAGIPIVAWQEWRRWRRKRRYEEKMGRQ